MILAWLSMLDGLLAAVILAAGVIGAHFNIAAPILGFQLFLFSFVIGALALILGLIGLLLTRSGARRSGRGPAKVGTFIGAAIVVPILLIVWQAMRTPYPVINDITTDYDNPPQFVKPPGIPSVNTFAYNRDWFAPRQTAGYAKLEPLHMSAKPDVAFEQVKATALAQPNWHVTYIDPATGTIEGIAVSFLFRFIDDFVIQVRPAPDGGSLIEMRSRSREGKGDFGVNYNRIVDFFATIKTRYAPAPSQAS